MSPLYGARRPPRSSRSRRDRFHPRTPGRGPWTTSRARDGRGADLGTTRQETPSHGTTRRRRPPPREADGDRADLHLRHRPYPLARNIERYRGEPGTAFQGPVRRGPRRATGLHREQLQSRGRPSPRGPSRYSPEDRDRLLRGAAVAPRAARARSANQDQRPHPQGSEEDGRRQEEGREEVSPVDPRLL